MGERIINISNNYLLEWALSQHRCWSPCRGFSSVHVPVNVDDAFGVQVGPWSWASERYYSVFYFVFVVVVLYYYKHEVKSSVLFISAKNPWPLFTTMQTTSPRGLFYTMSPRSEVIPPNFDWSCPLRLAIPTVYPELSFLPADQDHSGFNLRDKFRC